MTTKQNSVLTICILSMLTLNGCSTILSWDKEASTYSTTQPVDTYPAANPLDVKYMNKEGKMVTEPRWMDQQNSTFNQQWSDPNKMKPSHYEKHLHDSGNILPSVPYHKE